MGGMTAGQHARWACVYKTQPHIDGNGLSDDVKQSYALARDRFITFFGGGEDSSTAALTELRTLKQGQSPFHAFGPYFKVLLMRAMPEMPENMKLHYLYLTARGDLARKVMLRQPTTLDAAFSAALIEERVQLLLTKQPEDASAQEGCSAVTTAHAACSPSDYYRTSSSRSSHPVSTRRSKQALDLSPSSSYLEERPTLPATGVMEPPTLQSHKAKTWAA